LAGRPDDGETGFDEPETCLDPETSDRLAPAFLAAEFLLAAVEELNEIIKKRMKLLIKIDFNSFFLSMFLTMFLSGCNFYQFYN